MAKKKAKKKHNFKYTSPSQPVEQGIQPVRPATNTAAKVPTADFEDFSYVFRDVRKIVIMAAGFVILQIGFWFLLNHTSLGTAIYSQIKF